MEEPREYPEYILPHAEFGDPECCGLLFGVESGDDAKSLRRQASPERE
jgi:hypothetical protein